MGTLTPRDEYGNLQHVRFDAPVGHHWRGLLVLLGVAVLLIVGLLA